MAKVTYTDTTGEAPMVTWHGRSFTSGEAIDVPDVRSSAPLLDAAKSHPHFTVDGYDKADDLGDDPTPEPVAADPNADPRRLTGPAPAGFTIPGEEEGDDGDAAVPDADRPTPFSRGERAAANGKGRSVPVKYRGSDAAGQWLDGYDAEQRRRVDDHPDVVPGPSGRDQ